MKVSNNVPHAIDILIIIWIIFGSIGIVFATRKECTEKKEKAIAEIKIKSSSDLTLKQALFSKEFILIFIMQIFGLFLGATILTSYADFNSGFVPENVLVLSGSIGLICNATMRLLIGPLADKYGFKNNSN